MHISIYFTSDLSWMPETVAGSNYKAELRHPQIVVAINIKQYYNKIEDVSLSFDGVDGGSVSKLYMYLHGYGAEG